MRKPRSLYILDTETFHLIYGPAERENIASRVLMLAEQQTRRSILESRALLNSVEAIFSGWGAPVLDKDFLDAAPNLKIIFYAAGAIGSWMTDAAWQRGIRVTTASSANAIPVAEYTLATILFSLKHGWALSRQTREQRTFVPRDNAPGCFGSRIGLIGLGTIGRLVLSMLKRFDFEISVYDPFLSSSDAERLGVTRLTLPTLFASSDVVSLHAPELSETAGMITGELIDALPVGATFINTARGSIVRESEMLDVLERRPDLQAVLDVCDPEPPSPKSRLYTLPNVMLTPHIAGSVGRECQRMGRYMLEELDRYLAGVPLKWEITHDATLQSSHRPVRTVVPTITHSKPAIVNSKVLA